MVFSSLLFLFRFLPVFLVLYYLVPRRYRNGVLFAGSLIFYGWGEPVYLLILLFSTAVDFSLGKRAGRQRELGNRAGAFRAAALSAAINLSLLGFFKYTDVLIGAAGILTGKEYPLLNLALPIGISFYTFQTMSYTIDVARGRTGVQKDFIAFGAYVSMFPQLIAGPIVRYSTVERELTDRRESLWECSEGIRLFTVGLGKKVLIANQVGALWNEILHIAPEDRSVVMAWLGIFAFAMQIYFDFSGYSDMACGLGRMMGFHFPENFHYPYESRSITEFWRRWHISLETWFKEYVYLPLGGSRSGRAKQIRNILLVWLLTGIWHGAGWNFLLWGVYFGVLLLVEKLFLNRLLNRLPVGLQWAYAMLLVLFGWVLFAFDDLGQGWIYLGQMFGVEMRQAGAYLSGAATAGMTSAVPAGLAFFNDRTAYLIFTNLILLAVAAVGCTSFPAALCRNYLDPGMRRAAQPVFVLAVLFLSTAFLVNAGYNPFLYFRF